MLWATVAAATIEVASSTVVSFLSIMFISKVVCTAITTLERRIFK
jgi:hypothetical protein